MEKGTEKQEDKSIKNKKPVQITLQELRNSFLGAYGDRGDGDQKNAFSQKLSAYLRQEIGKNLVSEKYNILIIFDNLSMVKGDSDKIYTAINELKENKKPLLLVLVSNGGEPGSAYLIGKLCQNFCNEKFIVVVPRHAKSAATLLSCAAHEIHMGYLSELGPIDPQFNGMPALGLKNSIEHITELVAQNEAATEMFTRYLQRQVEPIQIGYYERVAKSLVQYAEKLLTKHKDELAKTPEEISNQLVYSYQDHGFVIDKEEATSIFGGNVIKCNTEEYNIGNIVYNVMSKVERWSEMGDCSFYFIGGLDSSPNVWRNPKR